MFRAVCVRYLDTLQHTARDAALVSLAMLRRCDPSVDPADSGREGDQVRDCIVSVRDQLDELLRAAQPVAGYQSCADDSRNNTQGGGPSDAELPATRVWPDQTVLEAEVGQALLHIAKGAYDEMLK